MTWRGPGDDAGCAKKTELGRRFSGGRELSGEYIEGLTSRAGSEPTLVSRVHVTIPFYLATRGPQKALAGCGVCSGRALSIYQRAHHSVRTSKV
jgi:hypothetical protein